MILLTALNTSSDYAQSVSLLYDKSLQVGAIAYPFLWGVAIVRRILNA